jgi:uncharacterized RDD family membrane protein YckC
MSHTPHEEPGLFDLPLAPAASDSEASVASTPRRSRRPPPAQPESLPLFGADELDGDADEPLDAPPAAVPEPTRRERAGAGTSVPRSRPVPLPPPAAATPTAPLGARLRGTAGDLAVLAAVTVLATGGASALEVEVGARELPGLGLFLLAWSFLYFVVSLAFWGQTPGMAWAGLVARSGEHEPLSFGQTARRWAGTWLTWIAVGLPGLLALGGRSLADRLSGSSTYELDAVPPLA